MKCIDNFVKNAADRISETGLVTELDEVTRIEFV